SRFCMSRFDARGARGEMLHKASAFDGMCKPVQRDQIFVRTALIQYAPLAVGLIEIENFQHFSDTLTSFIFAVSRETPASGEAQTEMMNIN
ncbi:MAG: hypothetical protein J7479_20235, partial [Roseiflexus sp.]|nr:hypothetical protein [Roseiflexus sp.]MBO9384617.1 hypothetical protein [Roseiflexus sp.]